MILIDLSQVMISNLFANLGALAYGSPNEKDAPEDPPYDEDLIRHMVLNSLRFYKMKFQAKYGKMVICCDSRHYWRRDVFPHYKANRRRDRDNSTLDWELIFESLNKIRDELQTFFPYRVFYVNRAEADDVIAVLAKRNHTAEKVLILSGDKDFVQLQKYKNIDQYAPIQKKFITSDDPVAALREHIMRGDSSDGIPNFLSPDDCFVSGKRQTPLREANLERWKKESKPENFCDIKMLRGWKRNQELIDLDFIPKEVQQAIIDESEKPFVETRKHLLNYFVSAGLANLMDHIQDF